MAVATPRELLVWWLQLAAFALLVVLVVFGFGRLPETVARPGALQCGPHVDVVLTWVNGSDPVHMAKRAQWRRASEDDNPGRFRDYDTLRYALRSVHAHLPPTRLIHLVMADGEAPPAWLNTSHTRVRVVRHSTLMDAATLPTFNSNAIETNLHRIPGLADCFVYLNDDMLFGRPVAWDTYWDAALSVQRVHFGTWTAPETEVREHVFLLLCAHAILRPCAQLLEGSSWHRAMARTNERLNAAYRSPGQRRAYPMHGCYFFHTATFTRMRERLDASWRTTLATRFRSENDNVVSFAYAHVAAREFGAYAVPFQVQYTALSPRAADNRQALRSMVRRRPQCVCINDGLEADSSLPEAQQSTRELRVALQVMFPEPGPWERRPLVDQEPPVSVSERRRLESVSVGELAVQLAVAGPLVAACVLMLACCVAGGCRGRNAQRD